MDTSPGEMMLYTIIAFLSPICLGNQELYDVFFFLSLFSNSAMFMQWNQSFPAENTGDLMADFVSFRINLIQTNSIAGVQNIMGQFTSEELCRFI